MGLLELVFTPSGVSRPVGQDPAAASCTALQEARRRGPLWTHSGDEERGRAVQREPRRPCCRWQ